MEFQSWFLFASIAFIATITPGPAVLLVTSHSATYGWKYAVFTILGNISGLFVMSALSVLGLSTIILSSAMVFGLVKVVGAAYLIYLGIKIWRNGFITLPNKHEAGLPQKRRNKAYLQGLAVALSNPKVIAFTTALFPQFIDHEGSLLAQFGLLVGTFTFLSFACLAGYAVAMEHTKSRMFNKFSGTLGKIFGTAFIASGIVLASATHKHT